MPPEQLRSRLLSLRKQRHLSIHQLLAEGGLLRLTIDTSWELYSESHNNRQNSIHCFKQLCQFRLGFGKHNNCGFGANKAMYRTKLCIEAELHTYHMYDAMTEDAPGYAAVWK